MKILIVDDNKQMRTAVKSIFPKENIEFHEASNGAEGIEIYSKILPDWVIMDIKMEKLNGIEATKQLKKINPSANIAILTNYDTKYYRKAAIDAGAEYFLSKQNLIELQSIFSNQAKNNEHNFK